MELVAAEDSAAAVAGRLACVANQCSEGLHEMGKKGEGERPEQPKAVLQDERVTGIRA